MKPLFRLIPCVLLAACGNESDKVERSQITFSEHVAPIIFENCSGCHRPGESGTVSFLTYDQVRRHASDIAEVTGSRYMPPWLPGDGDVAFKEARTLSAEQISTLQRWAENGAPRGEPALTPPLPEWTSGWQMGTPDYILELSEEFLLPAEGGDIFRNFVMPIPFDTTKFIRGVEFRPGNPAVVHHAWMTVDKTTSCRQLDAQHSDQIGFPGMGMGYSNPPEGHALGWTPGKLPHSVKPEMAFPLSKGQDLVLQLHMIPSGKTERVRPKIGFYYSAVPPTVFPYVLQLTPKAIDIPAGEKNYLVERNIRLPVDCQLLSIYPHAHYLCAQISIKAILPGGAEKILLNIPDWDFNWQDLFTLESPFDLPKGTMIEMRYRYDNSADNPRNPNSPPIRVREGDRTKDEMGNLWLQLLPVHPADRSVLHREVLQAKVEAHPTFFDLYNLGNQYVKEENLDLAVEAYHRAIELNPDHSLLHHNLAGALARLGEIDQAIDAMGNALALDPSYTSAHLNLGHLHAMKKNYSEALKEYRRAVELDPTNRRAQEHLSRLLNALGRQE